MTLDTRSSLLQQAELFIRTRGYSAFSYADLAERVGIRKASIHHHFATKEDLGCALVTDYRGRFQGDLEQIEESHRTATQRLRAYGNLFLVSFESGLLPFCCAMAVERSALPESVRQQVHNFFEFQIAWLVKVTEEGLSAGEFRVEKSAEAIAVTLMSALEGGSVIGWALQERDQILASFDCVLNTVMHVERSHPK
nr:TetR/AcrR family transcriptional regulator [Mesorhizobium sp. WSM4875]